VLKKGKRLTKAQLRTRPWPTPFIGAIDSNNGVAASVDAAIHEGGTITVNYNGAGVADSFYQPVSYWASDDVNVLYPKFEMSPAVALFPSGTTPATGCIRRTADLQTPNLLAPKRAVTSACVGQLSGDDFAISGTSNWP